MLEFHVRTECRLCGGSLTEVLDLGHTALANEVVDDPSEPQDTFPLKLVQCDECGHAQNPVVVSQERLFRNYSYTSGLTESYREHLREYAAQIATYLQPGDTLVEIGGNDGMLAASFEGTGIQYLNVDPSDVQQFWGIRERCFFRLEKAKALREKYGPAKVIVANHVFAHVDDLHDMAEGVRELLADDGTFFCEVGHGPTQLNSGCLDVIYHEHLSFHDERSFQKFLLKHGLCVVAFSDEAKAQGGSVRMVIRKSAHARTAGFLAAATSDRNPFNIPRIQQAADHLRGLGELLERATDNADELGIYGAPAKLTTLLELLGQPFSMHNWHVFDDSPRKVGKFTPGSHLPITAPTLQHDTLTCMNDCHFILIASWNFEKEIRERWKGYTGTWIVPLPEVRFYAGGGV